jgi:hypothetical protein
MPTAPPPSVHEVRAQFETLLNSVVSDEAHRMTANTRERRLLQQILALGRSLFALFLAARAEATRQGEHQGPDGVVRPYHSLRTRPYLSIFGLVHFARPYFYVYGAGGSVPVDAALSLPATSCSDVVRETLEELGVERAYHKATGVLRRLLGLEVSARMLTEQVAEDAPAAEAFSAQQTPPAVAEEAAILVLQADGKGVPILRPARPTGRVRLGKGQKNGGKKEAILTGLYTIATCVRTPEEVVASLFQETGAPAAPSCAQSRTGPQHKRLWVTLAGKDAALAEVAPQVQAREGSHILHRVALTDGSIPLQERVQRHVPQMTLVLDLIHGTEYLWKAANALLGETHPQRTAWVKARTLLLLQSHTDEVIAEFTRVAQEPRRTRLQRTVFTSVAGYLERNQPYMDYATYLAHGWPIATGVIEGACRHLVKDRCELSGMRWTIDGAEALLHLRCVQENGDWDAFHAFRRRLRHTRLYAVPYPEPMTPPDLQILAEVTPNLLPAAA